MLRFGYLVEPAGFDEVILYFNVGLKLHAQVNDEMARFMAEVVPAFVKAARLEGGCGAASDFLRRRIRPRPASATPSNVSEPGSGAGVDVVAVNVAVPSVTTSSSKYPSSVAKGWPLF